jgi:hypothetical protein
LKGGVDPSKISDDKYTIPNYKEFNNPMIPNEQKRIYNENKPKEIINPNQILNLQLYQPPRPKPPLGSQGSQPNPAVFYPNYVPDPFNPMGYANYMQCSQYGIQPPLSFPPIYKEYNINIGGVSGSHIKTAVMFEDSLPVKNITGTFNSLGERITMYESIRSILFSGGDGKDVPIESDSNNLLSHLKLMDMNPYNASRFSRNPYKGLPFGFLLYRSCYPVRHDTRNASAICSPNSTGINVRIYRLTEGAYMLNKQNITKAADYDEWRDIAFYNFVKEHIIKKKVCPNFTIMYGYNISTNSNINFDELRMIQNRGRMTDTSQFSNNKICQVGSTQQILMNQNMYRRDVNMPTNKPIPVPGGAMQQMVAVVRNPITGLVTNQIMNVPTREEQIIQLNKYSGKALVCLTEASNYSIIGWAKKEYRANGNIKTMINSGYHTKAVWQSVIFQMLVALYVMQIKGLIINNFRLDRNVFIKDVTTGGNVTNYWKYKIQGIEYYIPNYGYLVLIDTNFRDFDQPCPDNQGPGPGPGPGAQGARGAQGVPGAMGPGYDPDETRKLDGTFLDHCGLTIDQCIEKSFEAFRSSVDPNQYDQDFVNNDGIKPPEEILKLLSDIKNAADTKPTLDIAYYIRHFMTMFLNNRVGGPLAGSELDNVKRGGVKEFYKGQIVVMTDHDGVDKFVIHVKQKNNGVARIITKDKLNPETGNIIEKDVPTSSLNEYSVTEPIRQTFKMNESNLNEEALLETYTVE